MEIPLDAFHASAPARVAAHDEPREAKRAIAAVPLMSACPPDVFPARDRPLRAPGLPLGASRPKTRERVSRVFRAGVLRLRFAARSPPADETPRSVTPESVFLILTRLLSPSEFRRGHGYLRRRKRSRAHGRLPRGPRRGRAPRDRRDVRRVSADPAFAAAGAALAFALAWYAAAVAAAAARGGAAAPRDHLRRHRREESPRESLFRGGIPRFSWRRMQPAKRGRGKRLRDDADSKLAAAKRCAVGTAAIATVCAAARRSTPRCSSPRAPLLGPRRVGSPAPPPLAFAAETAGRLRGTAPLRFEVRRTAKDGTRHSRPHRASPESSPRRPARFPRRRRG